ncbi:MAG TPA: phosphatidate cytidylyltransferase [Planctomycetaceae bacterium]|jgi:phosphatidate cytidylyltransferase|nr:phosphatidate cytidylyltransferase [Planctomycetaceae bacterium]
MLGWRLLVSAVLIPAFVGLCYLDARLGPSAPVLLCLTLLIAVRSAWELVGLFHARSFRPSFVETALLSSLVVASAWLPHVEALRWLDRAGIDSGLVFGLCILWILASNAIRYRAPGQQMETLGAELLIVSYAGLLLCLTAHLFWVEPRLVTLKTHPGYYVLGSLIFAAKCGDIGAYTFGRLFGRRKMAPLLSPGKTWAGFLGAVIVAGLASYAWLQFGPRLFNAGWRPLSVTLCVSYGVLVAIAGVVGDLCESLIKRDLGKKDAARLLPGFGGLVDLTDSVVYAGPIAYLLWLTLPLVDWRWVE